MRRVIPLFALLVAGCNFDFTDTKEAAAVAQVEQLQRLAKAHTSRTGGPLDSIDTLANYSEDGEKELTDPWGQRYQFKYVDDPETQTERLVIWTTEPRSGKVIAAPRQLAPLVDSAN